MKKINNWKNRVKWVCFGLGLAMVFSSAFSDVSYFDFAKPQLAEAQVAPPNIFAKIVKEKTPAVVNISTKRVVRSRAAPQMQDERMREFYKRFFPKYKDAPQREQLRQSLGSGFVVEKDGYILTNNHVVEMADQILVAFGSGKHGDSEKEYEAKLIASDPKTDIALIKIESEEDFPTLSFGDSDALMVGEWVMAIGNPFGFAQSVTVGVVSAKGRVIGAGPYDDFIQTDASINPGNSGGPLLNIKGEVIGINTAIYTGGASQGNIGIGFAVPINSIKALYEDLKKGEVHRGWLGVSIQPVTPELQAALGLSSTKGALVGDVHPGSPSDKAGIKRGDVIMEFNGEEVPSSDQLPKMVAFLRPGTDVVVKIMSDGKEESINVTLGELPDQKVLSQKMEPKRSGEDLGMLVEELTPEIARRFGYPVDTGVVVAQVAQESPAQVAGIKAGDIILEINRLEVPDLSAYGNAIASLKPGDTALFLLQRGRSNLFVALKVPAE
ncbi:HtrA protease/chaperone protein [hydrothermal vent metagenome]|uniref:Probable periplasmic serine endoprotease DegP-like n=1 Tax=hydrothermal vent metagenome TaxID=652676 RepID=A0A3B1CSF2_9ZZZZ